MVKKRSSILLGITTLILGLSGPALVSRAALSATPAVSIDSQPLGVSVRRTVIPAYTFMTTDPLEHGHPAFVRLALGSQDPNRQEAVLSVYPLAGLLSTNPGDEGRRIQAQISRLRTLIKTRTNKVQGELPYLLEPNSSQVFAAAPRYLDFPGASGLRYLTMYSFDASPVTNDRMFYTFQGLTTDGRYALVLTYPVSTRHLPANDDAVPSALRTALEQGVGYSAYLTRTARTLSAARPADFSPPLDKLDAVARSIRIRH
ncbi:hypothetical protein [Deinococcus altitudinis]|uniref:hypothetical protein n=1 Tax=Deinococcus altitudinis TaxID=468914 RepID=UPI0038929E83